MTERRRLEQAVVDAEQARILARVEHELAFERVLLTETNYAVCAERLRAHVAKEGGPS